MDLDKVRVNCLTSRHASAGAIPITFDSDREALEAARTQFGGSNEQVRWVRIQDTLHLGEIYCTEALAAVCSQNEQIEIAAEAEPILFDDKGNLPR